jgi:hypothetical protein
MLVILTEESSMKVFLETLIKRYFPELRVSIKAFRGKQEIASSLDEKSASC